MRNVLLLIIFILTSGCSVTEKPNIIWITVEDQSAYFFPFYGNEDVSLPNLEELSKESLIFENMYATYPVCAPARSSIITGMYPQSIGTHNMRAMHYDNYLENDRNLGERTKWDSSLSIPRYSSTIAESIKTFPMILRQNGYFTYNDAKGDYNFIINDSTWSEYQTKNDITKDKSPLFAVYNFHGTHEGSIWQEDKSELMVNPSELTVPEIFPDDSVVRHSMAVNYTNLIKMDERVGRLISKLKKEDLYDDSYIFFYSDHGGPFPRHKRAIYETGTKVPFLVKFPVGKNEKVNKKQLLSFVDLAPTVLSIAGVKSPSEYQGFAFLGKNKSKIEREFLYTSSDRFDNVPDRIRAVRDSKFKYIRNYNPENSHALNVLYRKQMLLMRHLTSLHLTGQLDEKSDNWFKSPRLMEELYDLENDPFELNNLSLDPNHTDIKKKLSLNLDEFLLKIDDLGRIPEEELIKLISSED